MGVGNGRGQMEVLRDRFEARRNMQDFYVDIFKNIDRIKVFSDPSGDFHSNHWLSPIVIDEKILVKYR